MRYLKNIVLITCICVTSNLAKNVISFIGNNVFQPAKNLVELYVSFGTIVVLEGIIALILSISDIDGHCLLLLSVSDRRRI